jgi:hypothetical protein
MVFGSRIRSTWTCTLPISTKTLMDRFFRSALRRGRICQIIRALLRALVDVIDGIGLHPTHQFPALTGYSKARQDALAIPSIDYVYVDWITIRKVVYSEPTHSG